MMRDIVEEVFKEETKKNMLRALERDLKRYSNRKTAVILLEEIHNILEKLKFRRIW